MPQTPRIFVGTLHSGEAEFQLNQKAISQQSGVCVHHHVISDLPEREAHSTLWQAWNNVREQYDIFVKIDADTILSSDNALLNIYQLLTSKPGPTAAQIPLLDYYTDTLIMGLNAFSSEVVFETHSDALYTDRVAFTPCYIFTRNEVEPLSPIGYHGKTPSAKQAFFFGYHRMKKRQYSTIRNVALAWKKEKGRGRQTALLGALAACSPNLQIKDYSSSGFAQVLEQYTGSSKTQYIIQKFDFLFQLLSEKTLFQRALSKSICLLFSIFLWKGIDD